GCLGGCRLGRWSSQGEDGQQQRKPREHRRTKWMKSHAWTPCRELEGQRTAQSDLSLIRRTGGMCLGHQGEVESRHLACGQLGDPAGAELGEVRVVMEPAGELRVLSGFEVKEERLGSLHAVASHELPRDVFHLE